MGNITKRSSRELATEAPKLPEEGTPEALHHKLYEAIMREDCISIHSLLRSHPVDQPMTILANSTGYRLVLSQVPLLPTPFEKSRCCVPRWGPAGSRGLIPLPLPLARAVRVWGASQMNVHTDMTTGWNTSGGRNSIAGLTMYLPVVFPSV